MEHLVFDINQQHIWAIHFNMQTHEVSYVTGKSMLYSCHSSGGKMFKLNPKP